MKLGNFASLDPSVIESGSKGLKNRSKADSEIWSEFNKNWEELSVKAARILNPAVYEGELSVEETEFAYPPGMDKKTIVNARINQGFFREAVLSAYDYRCCITGISITGLLDASHIKPWKYSDPATERTNPCNGLCLNSLHHKAFDAGLIAIDGDYRLMLSHELERYGDSPSIDAFFYAHEGKRINLPHKFMPDPDMLKYHQEKIFLE